MKYRIFFYVIVSLLIPVYGYGQTITVYEETFDSPWNTGDWDQYTPEGGAWATQLAPFICQGDQAVSHWDNGEPVNAWIISDLIALEAGITYTCSFQQRVGNSSFPENMGTYIYQGNGADFTPGTATATIWQADNLTNETCASRSNTFTVLTNGSYNIVFHCTSAADEFLAIWDDVLITKPSAAKTPTPTPSTTPTPTPTPTCGPTIDPQSADVASGDFDGDGTDDIAIFRAGSGLWAVRGITRVYFGASGDLPVSGDYSGSDTTEISIYRGSTGLWAVRGITRFYLGSGAIPVPGDYDGDGFCDAGVFTDSSGRWQIKDVTGVYFGHYLDWPIPGDYTGDGTTDIGIFRGATGLWAVRGYTRAYYGHTPDWPIPGDYDGDGIDEIAIWRPCLGLWAQRDITRIYYGTCIDWPRPADYDGSGSDDIGIYREQTGLWAVRGVSRAYFGRLGDIPVTR